MNVVLRDRTENPLLSQILRDCVAHLDTGCPSGVQRTAAIHKENTGIFE